MWLLYAAGSAFFAGVTSVLAKCGIRKTNSTVATAVRTMVILVFSWVIVLAAGSADQMRDVSGRTFVFLILSGAATGASWLCYYRALKDGLASVVVPVDKLSILVTVVFSYLFLKEKISKKAAAGLVLMLAGTLLMAMIG